MESPSKTDEFVVRVPKNGVDDQKWSLLKFNNFLNVDVSRWTNSNLSIEREDNEASYNTIDKVQKTGVGSEFGKTLREEARRKKMGYSSATYSKDNQPWILTQNAGTSDAKKYRGIREGGVSQNADYWVLVKAGHSLFEAYPVDELYNFLPIARYKTLDVDEAEEKFLNRNKILNQFALKIKQQLEGNEALEASSAGGSRKQMDDDDDDTLSGRNKKNKGSDEEDVKPNKSTKLKKKRPLSKKNKTRKGSKDDDDQFASADSDDGDSEGREVDYMSDSELSYTSEEEPDDEKVRKALVGVDEELGIKKLIESDQEDEQAEGNEEEDDEEDKKFDIKAENMPTVGADQDERASDSGSDSEDFDEDIKAPFFMHDVKPSASANSSVAKESNGNGKDGSKRRITDETDYTPTKKIKTERETSETSGITVEEVKQYLQRKPQSSKDLVAKFKPMCQGMSKAEVVKYLADILKRLAPEQTQRNGTMYFFIKK